MAGQDSASESKLGRNWKIVALVAAVLMAGAVMGHSLLTSDRADRKETPASPVNTTIAGLEKSPADAHGACASKVEGGCCAKKSTGADSDATGESGCCAQKAAGCAGDGDGDVFQTSPSCCVGKPSCTE